MKLCIPTNDDNGLESSVCEHFGGAPFFMIADTETGAVTSLVNHNEHHAHGMCQPLKSLAGHVVDAVVCSGIGAGALNKLNASGIKVLMASGRTVRDLLDTHKKNSLPEFQPGSVCAHHGCH